MTSKDIIATVARSYGVEPGAIRGSRRWPDITAARAVAMYLARRFTQASYPTLGREFGGKHHTTVIAAVQKIDDRLRTDDALRAKVQQLITELVRPSEQDVESALSNLGAEHTSPPGWEDRVREAVAAPPDEEPG